VEWPAEFKAGKVYRHVPRDSASEHDALYDPFSAQTYHIRVAGNLAIWATIGSTAVVTANSAATFIPANVPEYFTVTSGQVLNFISTSTSTGYVALTEMT
jgi:hypothetical protein